MMKIIGLIFILIGTTLVASLPAAKEVEHFKKDNRIVGGYEVHISQHPHQVSMRRKSSSTAAFSHSCGGSIYNENVIVTAAHCIYNREPEEFIIVAGTSKRNGGDGVVSRVTKIIMHDGYEPSVYNNDVALMILATPLPLNNVTIAPIALTSEIPKNGAKSVITGWGTTSSGGVSSNQLLAVEVPIVGNSKCDAAYAVYYGPGRIYDSMLCAGVEGIGGKDACQGDSGGPLLVNDKLAGIVSWGRSCALPDYPGVYSNVAYLKQWIETNAQNYA